MWRLIWLLPSQLTHLLHLTCFGVSPDDLSFFRLYCVKSLVSSLSRSFSRDFSPSSVGVCKACPAWFVTLAKTTELPVDFDCRLRRHGATWFWILDGHKKEQNKIMRRITMLLMQYGSKSCWVTFLSFTMLQSLLNGTWTRKWFKTALCDISS